MISCIPRPSVCLQMTDKRFQDFTESLSYLLVHFRPGNSTKNKQTTGSSQRQNTQAQAKQHSVCSAVKPNMKQHRRLTSKGQDSAIHLHLKEKIHSFRDAIEE